MSAEQHDVIVLLDSDEEEDENECGNRRCAALLDHEDPGRCHHPSLSPPPPQQPHQHHPKNPKRYQHSGLVMQVCAILHVSETVALATLRATQFDLERAIDRLLTSTTTTTTPATTTTTTSTTASTGAVSDRTLAVGKRPRLSKDDSGVPRPNRSGSTTQEEEVVIVDRNSTTPDEPSSLRNVPPHPWRWKEPYGSPAAAAAATTAQPAFVDLDFPPCARSLDGRHRRRRDGEEGEEDEPFKDAATSGGSGVVRCVCGVPATPRTVQSDGPNYGRFYMTCGRVQAAAVAAAVAKRGRADGDEKSVTAPQPPPLCRFFQWDPCGALGAATAAAAPDGYGKSLAGLGWAHFGPTYGCVLVRHPRAYSPLHVRQGRIGDCWFLSALAVIAERPELIERVLGDGGWCNPPATQPDERGCYCIHLCLDGRWTPVTVDAHLPVVPVPPDAAPLTRGSGAGGLRRRRLAHDDGRDSVPLNKDGLRVVPAFAATPSRQLWPALVEKAYAKAHGSYSHLSGGFVAEALHDLTGAPTETILLEPHMEHPDLLWARLQSSRDAGFVMGVATSHAGRGNGSGGQQGLVGRHAYSLLDVVECPDAVVGEQAKLTDYFAGTSSSATAAGADSAETDSPTRPSQRRRRCSATERTTVRLVRLRNPWGKREWKGAWSARGPQWTAALRSRLKESWSEGDGTFFMSFEDLIRHFHHLDVAKARPGWLFGSLDGVFLQGNACMLASSKTVYRLHPRERTWAFISIIQPKKRANTTTRYFYCDPSFLVLKQKKQRSPSEVTDWECEATAICGIQRIATCEVFLDPAYLYLIVPFSGLAATGGPFPFRLACYSASSVGLERDSDLEDPRPSAVLELLHKQLLRLENKLLYQVAEKCQLACVHGHGCVYFLAINGGSDSFLSLKLVIDQADGMKTSIGRSDDTHDVPPCSQKILAVVSRDGRDSSSTHLKFRYLSSRVPVRRNAPRNKLSDPFVPQGAKLDQAIPITGAGDLLCSGVEARQVRIKGSDAIDTYSWIPQLGAM